MTSSTIVGPTKAFPVLLWLPILSVLCMGHVSSHLGWDPYGEESILLLIVWFALILTSMSHPLGVGHYGGGECKGSCLIGLCYINNIHTYVYNTTEAMRHQPAI